MNKKTFVYTTFQKEGYHCFPEAGTDPKYVTTDKYNVSHLAHRHMHYFNFKVWVEVTHSNRDIEFIQMRRQIEDWYGDEVLTLNGKSVEMMSEDLYEKLSTKYPGVEIRIDISEEGINGAYTEFR
jgi:PDZ domain-containing secreted protein